MRSLLLLPLLASASASTIIPPFDSPSCTAYAHALDLMHSLERTTDRGQVVNVASGKTGRLRSGDVWAQVWATTSTDPSGHVSRFNVGCHSGSDSVQDNPLRHVLRGITSALHKAYLLILLLLHTPLYGFLGIDILSSLTPSSTLPLPQMHEGTPMGRMLVGLLEEATMTAGEVCDGAWAMRGVVALVSCLFCL